MTFTAFVLLMTTPAWLALPRAERSGIAEAAFATAIPDDTVRLRYFDAEAFSGRVSDVAMLQAASPEAYYFAIERLRDTPLFTVPYFRIVEIIPAFEDGFQAFEARQDSGTVSATRG